MDENSFSHDFGGTGKCLIPEHRGGPPPANMPEAGPEGALEGLPGPAQAMFNRSASLL